MLTFKQAYDIDFLLFVKSQGKDFVDGYFSITINMNLSYIEMDRLDRKGARKGGEVCMGSESDGIYGKYYLHKYLVSLGTSARHEP
jgi:hypothetical protein